LSFAADVGRFAMHTSN